MTVYKKYHILIFIILASYFLPYVYLNKFRVDHLTSIFFLLYVIIFMVTNRKLSKDITYLAFFSVLVFIFISVRLMLFYEDFLQTIQIINQYSYILSGIGIYFFFKNKINYKSLIKYLYCLSLYVYVYAFLQVFNSESAIILLLNSLYEGTTSLEPLYGSYFSKSAEILSGGQAISIFTGMQGLAIYCLMIMSIALGSLKDIKMQRFRKFSIIMICISLYIGFLTGSKTFAFSLIIYLVLVLLYEPTKKMIILTISSFILLFITSLFSYQNNDILNIILNGNFSQIVSSRFGSDGYLNDVMYITYQIDTLIFGLGIDALKFKYADNQFRQVLIAGGAFFFLIYYFSILLWMRLMYKRRRYNSYSRYLFFLSIVLFIAGVGMDIYFQARVIVLLVFVSLFLCQIDVKNKIQILNIKDIN